MRLIDADALSESIKRGAGTDLQKFFADVCVATAPAVDAVVVTRCEDCKHYDMGACLKIYSDGNVHSAAWQSRNPDDYCNYGERKENNHEKV